MSFEYFYLLICDSLRIYSFDGVIFLQLNGLTVKLSIWFRITISESVSYKSIMSFPFDNLYVVDLIIFMYFVCVCECVSVDHSTHVTIDHVVCLSFSIPNNKMNLYFCICWLTTDLNIILFYKFCQILEFGILHNEWNIFYSFWAFV